MKITPYGGAGTIGGNKFLIEAGGARIFLDFGEPFDRGEPYYTGMEFMKPRKQLGLKDYFEFSMVPEIPGLYSQKALSHTSYPYSAPGFDAVLISHIHTDHHGDIEWLDPEIPVYMGHGAKKLNDIYNTCYPYNFRRHDNGNVKEFATGDKIVIKGLEITPVHVDHSTPAAYGFVIRSDEGVLAYTGDFRLHGFRPEMTRDFMREAKGAKILMCEGTRVKPADNNDPFRQEITEKQVEEKMYSLIKAEEGLVLADFSAKNIDRLRSLYNASKQAGRVMLVNPRTAYIMREAGALFAGTLPDPLNDSNIKVFRKNSDYDKTKEAAWEKPLLENSVDYEWVRENQGSAAMMITDTELQQLIDIKPKKGTFIYSMSEHYIEGEDNEEKRVALGAWLSHFNIRFEQAHCSGHASEAAVREMIDTAAPAAVAPMHTENPESFGSMHGSIIMLKKGETYEG